MLDIVIGVVGLVILFNFIKVLLKCKNPLKRAVLSMLTGAASLAAVSLAAGFFGYYVAVNFFTVFVALVLGVPGVALVVAGVVFL
ncbi:MAG: pro-sigmaK processing inhibitor BofA family protein [Oscillospiraceae bacterium]|nr:pro-sigmaK processing inhibitor BofA family protein [Oscillospiraceae bacterium]